MRRFTRPLCAVVALLSALAQAEAASLTGDGLDFTSSHRGLAPYLGSAFSDGTNHLFSTGVDDASAQAVDPLNPAAGRFGHFMRSALDAGTLDAPPGTVTTIAVGTASSAVKLTNPDLLFNPSSSALTVIDPASDLTRFAAGNPEEGGEMADAAGLHPEQGKPTAGVESSIPLPPAFPLLAAAVIALAAFGYGLNRWVAPRGAR